jgi:hypothetical protein
MDHGLEAILPLFGEHNLTLSLGGKPVRSTDRQENSKPSTASIQDTPGEHDDPAGRLT